jgi:hypothetical protein
MSFGPLLQASNRLSARRVSEPCARSPASSAIAFRASGRRSCAETAPTGLNEALQLLDELPALNRRRLLASYSNLTRVAQ